MTNPETDEDAWEEYPDLQPWFNKLKLALEQDEYAFPVGCRAPADGLYVCRPIYNLCGMGIGALTVPLKKDEPTENFPAGHFFQPYIEGVVTCVEATLISSDDILYEDTATSHGHRSTDSVKLDYFTFDFPPSGQSSLEEFIKTIEPLWKDIQLIKPRHICAEFVSMDDDRIMIDLHFRPNPDAGYHAKLLVPVPEMALPSDIEGIDLRYSSDEDFGRGGFLVGRE